MGQFSARGLTRPLVAPPKGELGIENEQAIAAAECATCPYGRQSGHRAAAQSGGSIPILSLTAPRIRCLQPRYRSVV